jgi:hypothetical protein
MHKLVMILIAAIVPVHAQAQGFATNDLTRIEASVTSALGQGFDGRAKSNRLTITCPSCTGKPIIDILLGQQNDGTEKRLRSGETKVSDLERLCKLNSPECRLSGLDVAPAVGWVTSYPIGDNAGATAIVLQDGDLLTIRSLAKNAPTARRNIDKLMPLIRTHVIGK